MADIKVKALADVVSGGKAHKAGSTFAANEVSISQAEAFGLVERVTQDKPKSKPRAKRRE